MWVQISSGQGPVECEMAVSLFFKSLLAEWSRHNRLVRGKPVRVYQGLDFRQVSDVKGRA